MQILLTRSIVLLILPEGLPDLFLKYVGKNSLEGNPLKVIALGFFAIKALLLYSQKNNDSLVTPV